jgi:hypothetical protein
LIWINGSTSRESGLIQLKAECGTSVQHAGGQGCVFNDRSEAMAHPARAVVLSAVLFLTQMVASLADDAHHPQGASPAQQAAPAKPDGSNDQTADSAQKNEQERPGGIMQGMMKNCPMMSGGKAEEGKMADCPMVKQHRSDGGSNSPQHGARPGMEGDGKGMMQRPGELGGATGSTRN